MNTQNKTKGFTIIEVVLVLAIAGLIFLMVFLALPALQRNQRDQQRTGDLGRLISAVQSYKSNNQGKRPLDMGGPTGSTNIIGSTYLDNFRTPAGDDYVLTAGPTLAGTATPSTTKPADEKTINYYINKTCSDAAAATTSGKIALVIWQENSGQRCQEL